MTAFKIHSAETMSEVNHESSMKIVTYVKRDQKAKRIEKLQKSPNTIQINQSTNDLDSNIFTATSNKTFNKANDPHYILENEKQSQQIVGKAAKE